MNVGVGGQSSAHKQLRLAKLVLETPHLTVIPSASQRNLMTETRGFLRKSMKKQALVGSRARVPVRSDRAQEGLQLLATS